ncbi:hypothetical protein ACQEVZ_30110 [Dactylosporangium sp. CA-152071]|uniref:hypothetical protein n=1 Tax=Dactylosporangium sp. CA-152071 TaxID=3239933 RepID=UPI003D913159
MLAAAITNLSSWKRSACLGCEQTVKQQRDAWAMIVSTRSGAWTAAMPIAAGQIGGSDETIPQEPLYLAGIAHQPCAHAARVRLLRGEVHLPPGLIEVLLRPTEHESPVLQVHLPAGPTDCLLCQSHDRPLTEEHLWSEWISKLLVARGARFPEQRGHETSPTGPRPRVLCPDCNNGWGSALESDVQKIMLPMFDGRAELDRHDQRRLASWALKTALVLDAIRRTRVVPRGFGQDLLIHQQPSPAVTVWVGRHMDDYNCLHAATKPLRFRPEGEESRPDEPNAFLATFVVYRLVFQVFISFYDAYIELTDPHPQIEQALTQIWPATGKVVRFTSPPAFDKRSVELLMMRIDDGIPKPAQ